MSAPKLILASSSKARISMLQKAGYVFEICAAEIDEEALRAAMPLQSPPEIALGLARAKARAVSENNPSAHVIGSDQVCAAGSILFSKAKDEDEALKKLKNLQGRRHDLYSAVTLYKDGQEVWSFCDDVSMNMKELSDEQIKSYLQKAGDVPTTCVGAYAIEEIGARLFKHIDGDYFSVLGMPLLPLISALDKEGFSL